MKDLLISVRASSQLEIVKIYLLISDIENATIEIDNCFKDIDNIDNEIVKKELYSLRGQIKYLNKEYELAAINLENAIKLTKWSKNSSFSINNTENRKEIQEISALFAIILEAYKKSKNQKKANETYSILLKLLDNISQKGIDNINSSKNLTLSDTEDKVNELKSILKKQKETMEFDRKIFNKQFK